MNPFVLLPLSFLAIDAEIRISEFREVGPGDLPVKQTNGSASVTTRSQIECAVQCAHDDSCKTIGYDEKTKQCMLNQPAAYATDLVYYRKVNANTGKLSLCIDFSLVASL